MATWVTPSEASQSAISSNSAVVVPKRRECRMTSPSTMSVAQARIEALCTSSPAQWACRMSIGVLRLGPPAAREGPRGMEQFALGAPRVRGGDRVGFDGGVEPSRGRARFVLGHGAPKTRRPCSRSRRIGTRILPVTLIFMGSGAPKEHDDSLRQTTADRIPTPVVPGRGGYGTVRRQRPPGRTALRLGTRHGREGTARVLPGGALPGELHGARPATE